MKTIFRVCAASRQGGFVAATAIIVLVSASPIFSRQAGAEQTAPIMLAQNDAPAANPSSGAKEPGTMHGRRHMHRENHESVDERIRNLHADLKITAAEEGNWNVVAQTMRDNAADMKKMVDNARAAASEASTALDDLKTYQHFAQAHADGLRKLLDAFTVLYQTMPPEQQKIADNVFGKYEHRRAGRRMH